MIVKSIVAILVLILSVLGFIIIKNTVYWRIRNRWRSTFIQMPSLSEQDKHYIRIIKKTPRFTESIREIENAEDELHIPVNNGEDRVYTVTIDKDDNDDDKCLKLRRNGNLIVTLHPHRPKDLPEVVGDEQIRLVYVNTKTYGKN